MSDTLDPPPPDRRRGARRVPGSSSAGGRASPAGPGVVVGTLVTAVAAAGLALADDRLYARLGVPVPAPTFRMVVTGLRLVAELGAGLAAGCLLVALLVVRPRPDGGLAAAGYRALRWAGWSAAAAAPAALLLVGASTAELSGTAPARLLAGDPWSLMVGLGEPVAWLVTGVGSAIVAAGALLALTWRPVPPLCAVALVGVLAPAWSGPAGSGAGHDWATDLVTVEAGSGALLLGAAVWAGTVRSPGPGEVRRAAAAAVTGWVGLLATGSSLCTLWSAPGPGSAWDAVAGGRIGLLTVAGVAGALLWRRFPGTTAGGPRRAAVALLVGAVGAVGLHTVLGRWVPPLFLTRSDTVAESLLGYELPDPVSAGRLLLDWRPNILVVVAAAALVAAYLVGVRRLAGRGDAWPPGRTAAWVAGCATLVLTTSSGLGRYGPAVFSTHMISHMSLSMLVPVLLALGGPVTLALRALPPAGPDGRPGPRELIVAVLGSRVARTLTHPLPALAVFGGSFFVLYLTGLFEVALRYHWAHQLMNAHFVLVGYLFFWPIIGADRSPVVLPHLGRLAMVLAAMPFHAVFGLTVMNHAEILGGRFYELLALPWADLAADQRLGGGIAWAGGEVPMLLVVLLLVRRWARDDAREAARFDRRAGSADDLAAYNAMLARLAGTDG